ncbi:hypothetical protein BFP97_13250 [Roseivirga sp. 4D4]|uniref:phosphotransferase enzyme family protein n=1 Tax=Roseivirga sp. 4D4 TaxID=1889784 RepID=UPI000852D3AA|nr:aminoglycoside phosphotransferase family protein [Roseivirga sp. 4D4]OEK02429.1 hypothetical protein BFP97_13250 [Roseivirga sp. 4D4]
MEAAQKALQTFNIKGAIMSVAPFGLGHINDSYLVKTHDKQYLLQRINKQVFQSPQLIESNFQVLLSRTSNLFVRHYKTIDNAFHAEVEGDFWRLSDFIANAYAPETAHRLKEVESVALGFGILTAYMSSFCPAQFEEAIPKFHDLSWRLDQFAMAVDSDPVNRLETSRDLVEKVENFRWILDQMNELKDRGLPLRVCHNDTKLNNCLLSKSDQNFEHIIDLDTLGPGFVLYDYGDLMRTVLSPTAENEVDSDKIHIQQDYLNALRRGFIQGTGDVLSSIEIDNLEFGGLYMTFTMGVRFLTDYLNGDIYYKTSFENENFIRARNQFALLELMHAL